MCGILGNIGRRAAADQWAAACAIQRPRGPDSQGEWHGSAGGFDVSLGHQRLSIIDLSPTGAQPMVHPATRSVLSFNGEIYNYIELRERLLNEGERFVGHSDTEVLLHALEHWGVERTLPLLNGMWAFAWADVRRGLVVLSRDRCGEKPLYVATDGGRTVFASDLRAILHLAPKARSLDRSALVDFLKLGLLNAGTRTMFEGIEQVPAGAFIVFKAGDPGTIPAAKTFWTCPVVAKSLPLPDLIDNLRELFIDSVRIRLRSDVPIGLLLSGGLDSSSIAAATHNLGARNITMLSLVSDNPEVNEGPYIDAVVRHIGANVHLVRLPEDPVILLSHLADLVDCMGAPVTSLSNIAHWMLMRAARNRGMRVVLSGQGGDEILCGYRKYTGFHLQQLLRSGQPLAAAAAIWSFLRNKTVSRKFSIAEAARYLPMPFRLRAHSRLGPFLRDEPTRSPGLLPYETISERQRRDICELSIPTLTHFEDRSSMSNSNEIRLPFLDHRIIELLVPTPTEQKLHRGWPKYPLRAAMERDLPASIAWRRDKQGFSNPEAHWMRTTLRQQFEDRFLRADAQVFDRGILDFEGVSRSWRDFCSRPNSTVWVRDFVQLMSLEIWLSLNQRHLTD
jgi:asparagine synthase (glutamine-hydrolysing)